MSLWLFLVGISTGWAVDHAPWQAVLDRYRDASGQVDYAGVQQADALAGYLAALAVAELPADPSERMAFWLNAYNAITVDVVAEAWPIQSIKALDEGKLWTARTFVVAGQPYTLDGIEKQQLVPMKDPRIHVALNCASKGCPLLQARAFSGASLQAQLDAASRAWVQGRAVVVEEQTGRVQLSTILDWYSGEFVPGAGESVPGVADRLQGVIQFVARHAGSEQAAVLRAGNYPVGFLPFDWSVNAQ